jgi:hypothetical protein
MNEVLDQQFQRVDAALKTLVESISSYNPSPAAALDLVAADEELSQGLQQLSVHQANYARILALRHRADTLDGQVKEKLAILADARKELMATPITIAPENSRNVPLDELLAYARRISKFTVPPTYRPPLPGEVTNGGTHDGETSPNQPEPVAKAENGLAAAADEPSGHLHQASEQPVQSVGLSALSDEQRAWLESASKIAFVPWPNDNVIRRGGLAHIQTMVEQGQDPASFYSDPQSLVEQASAEEEQTRLSRVEEDVQARQGHAARAQQPARIEQAPAVFGGLELYDPEET